MIFIEPDQLGSRVLELTPLVCVWTTAEEGEFLCPYMIVLRT